MRKMQDALLTAPTLAHDDDDGDLILKTDANKHGLGAVLSRVKGKTERPIIFISRRTSKAEINYHSNALECLALAWALDKLKPYVYGRNFTIFTDNSALKWLFSKKDIDGKYARWILALQEFQIQIKHIKGHLNVVADALSRFPVGESKETNLSEAMCCAMVGSFHPPEDIALLQHDDRATRLIRMQSQENGATASDTFVLRKDVLYRKNRQKGRKLLLVVPSFLRRQVLSACHDDPSSGHMEGKLMSIPVPSSPFHTLGMDHMGPFRQTPKGNVHALVIMDYLSKWIIVTPCPDIKTRGVVEILNQAVIPQHGFMRRIITDQGTAFTSESFDMEMEKSSIHHVLATCQRPQTNGQVERANKTFVSALKSYVNLAHDDWDLHIPMATLAINSARQSTTKRSPFELVYGRIPILSHENSFPWPDKPPERVKQFFRRVARWREEANKLIQDSQDRSKQLADPHRRNAREYVEGELVLVRRNIRRNGRTKQLLPKFIGPFEIVKRVCPTTNLVEDPPTKRKRMVWRRFNAHVAQMRPFYHPRETEWLPEDSSSDSDTEEEIYPLESDTGTIAESPNSSASGNDEPPGIITEPMDESAMLPAGTLTLAGRRTRPPFWRQQDLN
ncbi:Uncharacterized protein APZ42_033963 [Daphnia magna]|uniref:Integrase catalytic domain-containing protein n=1 Tax=Daphnia magna TaxID=35525 RepID=A0A164KK83_9CRUS|nr:Uncharacterized protein APZ42_033963 [Daphnia magna]